MDAFTGMEQKQLKSMKGLSVGFILAPNFTLIALSGFLAVLRQASDVGDKSRQVMCRWTIMQKALVRGLTNLLSIICVENTLILP